MGAEKSKITPSDLKELADQTDFTEREIRIWYKSFKKDCPTGKLTLDEFKKLYREFFPGGDATAFAKHCFRTFDNNGDGTIDFREFMCALSVTSRGSFDDKLAWAYNMYDQDGDGNVTKSEMLEIITAIYKMVGEEKLAQVIQDRLTAKERVDKIFDRMDKDGDQAITLEEFKKAANEDPSLVLLLQVNSGDAGQNEPVKS